MCGCPKRTGGNPRAIADDVWAKLMWPWRYYDLDHGYCTYDFFEQCQHRMACSKCDFYLPKESTAALLLERKSHLLRLLQEIPLGEAEQAAVEDGLTA